MARGAGFIEYGENGKGVHSRWYPQTLKRRITEIAHVRSRIEFVHGDAFEVIEKYSDCEGAVFFIDPPYTASKKKAGSRLYNHFDVDHARLFREAATVRGEVLLTYDNAEEILELAAAVGMQTRAISMKNNHHAEMTELLIGKDLSWVSS
jgi:DNA adenine methylase